MNIHNQMEDLATQLVDDIFGEEKSKQKKTFCVCNQCRLDVSCYVLNRLEPRYVISERGVAHTESGYLEKVQENADIATLIREGIDRVSSTKRPFFSHSGDDDFHPQKGAVFSFPMIKGRVFNGNNFEPISDINVLLRVDSQPAVMVDPNWRNPCYIYESGAGSFFFLPSPVEADKSGEKKSFKFEIFIDDRRFEPLHHFFSISAISDEVFRYTVRTNESYACEDLYLFPTE